MKQILVILFITLELTISCSSNTDQSEDQSSNADVQSNQIANVDSLDTDTTRSYIYSNIPAYLNTEPDSILSLIRSNNDRGFSLANLRKSLAALNFNPISGDDDFYYAKRSFNTRIYVSIEDTLIDNKKIYINSFMWDKGKKYNSVILYLTNPQ